MNALDTASRDELMAAIDRKDGHQWLELAEWNWVQIGRGEILHAVRAMDDDLAEVGRTWGGSGLTECGRKGDLRIPGVFSRMSAKRCSRCCKAIGMPQGNQSPKNVDECRPIVEARIKELVDV